MNVRIKYFLVLIVCFSFIFMFVKNLDAAEVTGEFQTANTAPNDPSYFRVKDMDTGSCTAYNTPYDPNENDCFDFYDIDDDAPDDDGLGYADTHMAYDSTSTDPLIIRWDEFDAESNPIRTLICISSTNLLRNAASPQAGGDSINCDILNLFDPVVDGVVGGSYTFDQLEASGLIYDNTRDTPGSLEQVQYFVRLMSLDNADAQSGFYDVDFYVMNNVPEIIDVGFSFVTPDVGDSSNEGGTPFYAGNKDTHSRTPSLDWNDATDADTAGTKDFYPPDSLTYNIEVGDESLDNFGNYLSVTGLLTSNYDGSNWVTDSGNLLDWGTFDDTFGVSRASYSIIINVTDGIIDGGLNDVVDGSKIDSFDLADRLPKIKKVRMADDLIFDDTKNCDYEGYPDVDGNFCTLTPVARDYAQDINLLVIIEDKDNDCLATSTDYPSCDDGTVGYGCMNVSIGLCRDSFIPPGILPGTACSDGNFDWGLFTFDTVADGTLNECELSLSIGNRINEGGLSDGETPEYFIPSGAHSIHVIAKSQSDVQINTDNEEYLITLLSGTSTDGIGEYADPYPGIRTLSWWYNNNIGIRYEDDSMGEIIDPAVVTVGAATNVPGLWNDGINQYVVRNMANTILDLGYDSTDFNKSDGDWAPNPINQWCDADYGQWCSWLIDDPTYRFVLDDDTVSLGHLDTDTGNLGEVDVRRYDGVTAFRVNFQHPGGLELCTVFDCNIPISYPSGSGTLYKLNNYWHINPTSGLRPGVYRATIGIVPTPH